MLKVFDKNDCAYQNWVSANKNGYVLNMRRTITPSYAVLHRASCSSISYKKSLMREGAFTERGYIKICALDIESLRVWVSSHGRPDGSFSKECARCG